MRHAEFGGGSRSPFGISAGSANREWWEEAVVQGCCEGSLFDELDEAAPAPTQIDASVISAAQSQKCCSAA